MNWTAEQIAELTDKWAAGHSGAQIAEMLQVSRSAIIGKVHRLKLPDPAIKLPVTIKNGVIRKAPIVRVPKLKLRPWRIPEEATELPPDQSDCAVTLVELESRHCRWPLGEGPAKLFCGTQKADGHSYCSRHCGMAYKRSPPRITDDERARRATHWRKITKAYKADYLTRIEEAA